MGILDCFQHTRTNTASIAKERLKIIVSHERSLRHGGLDYLPRMQQDILDVIKKYIEIDSDQLKMNIEHDNDYEVLEMNITFPDSQNLFKPIES